MGLPRGSFPVSEKIHAEVLSMPLYPTMTPIETAEVVTKVCQLRISV